MAHACSFRGYCYGHIPFVSTESPHVPRMYAAGHPESHYLKSGAGAGGPFTTDPAAQSSPTQVRRSCNCCWVFFKFVLFVLFLSSHCHVTKKFNAFLKFYFLDFQVYLQKLLSEKRNMQPYAWLILFKKCYVMKPSCQIYMKSGFKSTTVCSFSRDNDI